MENHKIDSIPTHLFDRIEKSGTCELGYWAEGMGMYIYHKFLKVYKLPPLPASLNNPIVERKVRKDINEMEGTEIEVVEDIGTTLEELAVGCIMCHRCEKECPEKAIDIGAGTDLIARYSTQKCLGTACKRCVSVCPVHAITYKEIRIMA